MDLTTEVVQEAPFSPALGAQSGQEPPTQGEKSIDELIEVERKEIEKIDEINKEESDEHEKGETGEEGEEDEEAESSQEYKPSHKYKVKDTEYEFHKDLAGVIDEKTEPIIRELYEKAHGIDEVKASREKVTQERDQIRTNFQSMAAEVGQVLKYKKAGDLKSFFEAVQLTDDDIASYIMEQARIKTLPPEQQAVYNEREQLRKRMNQLEDNFQQVSTTQTSTQVQARIGELDSALNTDEKFKAISKDFDARNGAGSFKQAIMSNAASHWHATKEDLSAKDAVDRFIKMTGLTPPKVAPKPGPNATKRVVSRPQVKTLPNYGRSQGSVTAEHKPKSIEDLKKIRKEKYGA